MPPPVLNDETNPYIILGVNKKTPFAKITKNYHKLSKQFHPDHQSGDTTIQTRINLAYEKIKEDKKSGKKNKGEAEPLKFTPPPNLGFEKQLLHLIEQYRISSVNTEQVIQFLYDNMPSQFNKILSALEGTLEQQANHAKIKAFLLQSDISLGLLKHCYEQSAHQLREGYSCYHEKLFKITPWLVADTLLPEKLFTDDVVEESTADDLSTAAFTKKETVPLFIKIVRHFSTLFGCRLDDDALAMDRFLSFLCPYLDIGSTTEFKQQLKQQTLTCLMGFKSREAFLFLLEYPELLYYQRVFVAFASLKQEHDERLFFQHRASSSVFSPFFLLDEGLPDYNVANERDYHARQRHGLCVTEKVATRNLLRFRGADPRVPAETEKVNPSFFRFFQKKNDSHKLSELLVRHQEALRTLYVGHPRLPENFEPVQRWERLNEFFYSPFYQHLVKDIFFPLIETKRRLDKEIEKEHKILNEWKAWGQPRKDYENDQGPLADAERKWHLINNITEDFEHTILEAFESKHPRTPDEFEAVQHLIVSQIKARTLQVVEGRQKTLTAQRDDVGMVLSYISGAIVGLLTFPVLISGTYRKLLHERFFSTKTDAAMQKVLRKLPATHYEIDLITGFADTPPASVQEKYIKNNKPFLYQYANNQIVMFGCLHDGWKFTTLNQSALKEIAFPPLHKTSTLSVEWVGALHEELKKGHHFSTQTDTTLPSLPELKTPSTSSASSQSSSSSSTNAPVPPPLSMPTAAAPTPSSPTATPPPDQYPTPPLFFGPSYYY